MTDTKKSMDMMDIIDKFIKDGMEETLDKYSNDLPYVQFLKAMTKPDKIEYVFSWNKTRVEDDKELKKLKIFLSHNLGIDWAMEADIEKSDDTIRIYKGESSHSLKLNHKKTEVILEINPNKIKKFIAKRENEKLCIYNYNKKISDHVQNVVKKLHHLLNNEIDEVVELNKSNGSENYKNFLEYIVNSVSVPDDKKPLLLCTALYHDIGKSMIDARHGPEGADVIKDSGLEQREQFRKLGFERYDFYFMSDLIRFHDYLGMLCTGEVSYLIMTEALNPVSNISLSNDKYSEKFFSFLFLLNLADISGTIGKVDSEDFTIMVHDFERIKKIYKSTEDKEIYKITEDTKPFRYAENRNVVQELLKLSEIHTHERLRRLLRNGFKNLYKIDSEELQNYIKWINDRKDSNNLPNPIQFSSWFSRNDQKGTNDIIPLNSSIRAINIKPDFSTKFAYVCKLDYFLGFLRDLFEKLLIIESKKMSGPEKFRKGSHDLRRDFSMTLMELIDVLVEQYGDFTSNNTKIGLGFERYKELKDMKCHDKMLTRLTGVNGEFKEAEAFTKLRNMAVLWVIRP